MPLRAPSFLKRRKSSSSSAATERRILIRQPDEPALSEQTKWGMTLLDSSEQLVTKFGGVPVEAVKENSPAARAGVSPGDVIRAVSGNKVENLGVFKGAMVASFLEGTLKLEIDVIVQSEALTKWLEQRARAEQLEAAEAEELALALAASQCSGQAPTAQGQLQPAPPPDEEEAALAAALAESAREAAAATQRAAAPVDEEDDAELRRALAESSAAAEAAPSPAADEASARALAAEEDLSLIHI